MGMCTVTEFFSLFKDLYEQHSLHYDVGKCINCGVLRVLLQGGVDVWKLHVDSV